MTTTASRQRGQDGRFSAVPKELCERPQWVVWRLEDRDGKPTKVPYCAGTGRHASSADAATWVPYDDAVRAAMNGTYSGIGFVLSKDDPYTGIDLDHVRDPVTGEVDPVAMRIVERLNSYTEVSQSGTGLHVLVQATLPGPGRRTRLVGALRDDAQIEMYDSGRYFVMTGDPLR